MNEEEAYQQLSNRSKRDELLAAGYSEKPCGCLTGCHRCQGAGVVWEEPPVHMQPQYALPFLDRIIDRDRNASRSYREVESQARRDSSEALERNMAVSAVIRQRIAAKGGARRLMAPPTPNPKTIPYDAEPTQGFQQQFRCRPFDPLNPDIANADQEFIRNVEETLKKNSVGGETT